MNAAIPVDNVTPIAKPTISYVTVTPDVARRWLTHNRINRRLDWPTVEKYAATMKAGNWSLDSNAISFDPEGNLLNGQHRLSAVRLAGVSVVFAVQRNVPPEAMKFMDRGRGRTTAQNLSFEGEKNATILSATMRQLASIHYEVAPSRVSDDMLYGLLERIPEVRASVSVGCNSRADIDAPPTAIVMAHWLIWQATGRQEWADLYIETLRTRAGEPAKSAIHAVDKRLREIRKHGQKFVAIDFVHLLLKGWNYWSANRSVAKLQMPRRGDDLPSIGTWRR